MLAVICASVFTVSFFGNMYTYALAQLHPDPDPEPCPPHCKPQCPCPQQQQCGYCKCPCPNGGHGEDDLRYLHEPKVEFPTVQELFDYYYQRGIEKEEFSIISNGTEGVPSDAVAAISGDSIYVAWLGEANGTNGAFLAVSRDNGATYEKPVQLSPENSGNITDLQIGVTDSGRFVDLAWQETPNNGTSRVFFSNSMNFGQDFKTYPLNLPTNGSATNPVLEVKGENVVLVWEQETLSANGTKGNVMYSHGGRW